MAKNVKVTVPHKSTHDLSTRRTGTATCGTLVPVLCTELMAGSEFSLSTAVKAELAPLATDPFMNCDIRFEAFAVPHRVLMKNFPKWLTGEPIRQLQSGSIVTTYAAMPNITLNKGNATGTPWVTNGKTKLKAGTLADYLGIRLRDSDFAKLDSVSAVIKVNPLPFLCYHRIWDDYYRNAKIQQSCFTDSYNTFASGYFFGGNLDGAVELTASSPYQVQNLSVNMSDSSPWDSFKLADSVNLFDLRQRNFGYDYFTNANSAPQLGAAQSVSTSGASFTIASLRAANSLQMWLERSQLGSYRWQEYLHAHYGTNLSSGIAQRSIYLGRYNMSVYTKGVEQTAIPTNASINPTSSNVITNRNPFRGLVGAKYGNAFVQDDGHLVDKVSFDEPVYVMVMMSLVPKVVYSSGISSYLTRYTKAGSVVDMADPLLQNTGNVPINVYEVCGEIGTGVSAFFGYRGAYEDWMTQPDTLHGLLRVDENLDAFALQRYVGRNSGANPVIGSNFLEIPKDYLKQVLVFNEASYQEDTDIPVSGFDYWFDCLFDFPVSHPLHEYSIPSLQDPAAEHGKVVTIDTFSQL